MTRRWRELFLLPPPLLFSPYTARPRVQQTWPLRVLLLCPDAAICVRILGRILFSYYYYTCAATGSCPTHMPAL